MCENLERITSKELESMLSDIEAKWARMDADWDVMQKRHMLARDKIRKRLFELITIMKFVESRDCKSEVSDLPCQDANEHDCFDEDCIVGEDLRSAVCDDMLFFEASGMKPATIHFVFDNSEDRYQPFESWFDYVLKVCRMAIKRYGGDAFKNAVFFDDDSDKDYVWSRLHIFIMFDDDLDVSSYKNIGNGVCIIPQYGVQKCRVLISDLEKKFPLVKSELIFV